MVSQASFFILNRFNVDKYSHTRSYDHMQDILSELVETVSSRVITQRIRAKYPDLYAWILSETEALKNVKFVERIWFILNGRPEFICPNGKKKTFNPKKHEYGFCDHQTRCPCFAQHIKDTYTPRDMKNIVEKRKDTWLKKYGVENPSQNAECQSKRLATIASRDYSVQRRLTAYEKESKGYEQVIQRVKEYVTPLFGRDEYSGSRCANVYDWKCIKCDGQFKSHIDWGSFPKCPTCYPKKNSSIGEDQVAEYVKSLGFDVIRNDRSVLGNLELDIYIKDKKIAIEYNGIYWHSSEKKRPTYHVDKFLRCKALGIHLIQIFDFEWEMSGDIVRRRLASILGCNTRIPARKCILVELNTSEYKTFVVQNHLSGYAAATYRYGLVYENELVAVMSFAKSRYTKTGMEMVRFCSTHNVVGGASKLLVHFIRQHSPDEIVSFANRCWSNGGLYRSLGFTDVTLKENNTGYWYVRDGVKHHRSSFTKSRLVKIGYPTDQSESEIMKNAGYLKIHDCGNYKFIWKPH